MIAITIIFCAFLLMLAVPKRSYPWVISVVVPTYAWLCWIITRPLPMSDNWGAIDRGIIWIVLFFGMTPALCRSLHSRQTNANFSSEVDWTPTQVSCLFVAIWGGAWFLTPTVPVFAGAATCVAIGLMLSLAMFGMATRDLRHRAIFITAGAALVTGMIAILMWPLVVVAAAENRSAGRPYCLVVSRGVNYRTATNLLDLTPLIMRGRESRISAFNYHGELLTLGEANRNWSYRHRDFIDKSSDNEQPRCVAAIGFARKLPWF